MSKFTPGPWKMAVDDKGVGQLIPRGHDEICCVVSASFDAIEVYAERQDWDDDPLPDARLIAASPTLYEACLTALRTLADWDRDDGEAGDALREALSAAGWDGEL